VVNRPNCNGPGFWCDTTRCHGPVPGRNRTRNQTGNLDPLLTLCTTPVTDEQLQQEVAAITCIQPQCMMAVRDLMTQFTSTPMQAEVTAETVPQGVARQRAESF